MLPTRGRLSPSGERAKETPNDMFLHGTPCYAYMLISCMLLLGVSIVDNMVHCSFRSISMIFVCREHAEKATGDGGQNTFHLIRTIYRKFRCDIQHCCIRSCCSSWGAENLRVLVRSSLCLPLSSSFSRGETACCKKAWTLAALAVETVRWARPVAQAPTLMLTL